MNNQFLCKKCEIKIDKIMNLTVDEYKEEIFQEHIYFFEYEGFIRDLIINYKFHEKTYLYKSFIKIIKNQKLMEILKSYDIIIPVPISKERKKQRGYNQSLLIASKLAEFYNKKLKTNCLIKTKNIIEQSKLNKDERAINIKNAYMLKNKQILTNKRILVVDDIYTTGNTVKECSQMIKKANPKSIGILTIAKDFINKRKE